MLAVSFLSADARAQILGSNLLVNGDAELATASDVKPPGWTVKGPVTIRTYASRSPVDVEAGDLVPMNRGSRYFAADTSNQAESDSAIVQRVNLSSVAALADQGSLTCELSAYLGARISGAADAPFSTGAILRWSFLDAKGEIIRNGNRLGDARNVSGLRFIRTVELVPPLARSVEITVQFVRSGGGIADNISLVLSAAQPAESILGRNLVVNGDAEAGPASKPGVATPDVPGWQHRFSVADYATTVNGLSVAKPVGGTAGGSNFFYALPPIGLSQSFQAIDISAASAHADTGQLTFALTAWLGRLAGRDGSDVRVSFEDWNEQLSSAVLQGPLPSEQVRAGQMLLRSTRGPIPRGTRVINLSLNLGAPIGSEVTAPFGLADEISLVLSSTGMPSSAPAIFRIQTAGGFGGVHPIAPGTWIEIYGRNLASTTREWSSTDFRGDNPPVELDGTSVMINGQSVPVAFVSPGQVNAYLPLCCFVNATPMSTATVVARGGRSANFVVGAQASTPGLLAPAVFRIAGKQYVAAFHQDGASVLPRGAIPGVQSRPARAGDTITLYGIGFGAVIPEINDGLPVQV
ncbi:MAG: hypothetical protein IAG10_17360, partial [Planctomycetaceae bacterium]|nr:hypothetical protein [Planctomycetaceae bacterium]